MFKKYSQQSGFTLIELLTVVTITAILGTYFVAPLTIEKINLKRGEVSIGETNLIQSAALNYYASNGAWPGGAGCGAAITALTTDGLLANIDATNAFNGSITTSCTSTLFVVNQVTLAGYGGYLANGLAASIVVNAGTGEVTSAIGVPGSEPALSLLLDLAGTRAMTGNLQMGGKSITGAANVTMTGTSTALRHTSTADSRAPRFYDTNNASYYADPASTSKFNYVDAHRFRDSGNTGFYLDPASTSYLNDVRASIMYDRDNTSYYVNPASTSKMNRIDASIVYDRDNTAYYSNPASTSKFNYVDAHRFRDSGNTTFYVDPASTSYLNDVRANIFYDKGNTAYYLNPNGTSKLATVYADRVYDRNNSSYYVDPASTSRLNYANLNYAKLTSSFTKGSGCTTKQIGTTSTGEFMSCVSGIWTSPGGGIVASSYGSKVGYAKYNDGLMLQWGRNGFESGTERYTVTFPQRFIVAPNVVAQAEYSGAWNRNVSSYSISTTKVSFLGNSNLPFHWQAIGRWK